MNKIGHIKGAAFMDPVIYGWNSDHKIFKELIAQTKPKVIIEVGTWKGASAITMGKAVKELGLDTKIYCVDTWLGAEEFYTTHKETPERDLMMCSGYPQVYFQFASNVIHSGLRDMIIPIPNTSAIAARILKYEGIKADLIYIDGSHEYEDVRRDIKDYSELLNENGVMFGDDYGWLDVGNAVKDSFSYTDIDIIDQTYWVYNNTKK